MQTTLIISKVGAKATLAPRPFSDLFCVLRIRSMVFADIKAVVVSFSNRPEQEDNEVACVAL
jgi:hypothetical protein